MKKQTLLLAVTIMAGYASAQTLLVNTGDVTYTIPARQAGEMNYQSGKTILIGNKSYSLSEITNIEVTDSEVTDSRVDVVYNGNSAHVTIAGNIAQYLSPTVKGAHVSIAAMGSPAAMTGVTVTKLLFILRAMPNGAVPVWQVLPAM